MCGQLAHRPTAPLDPLQAAHPGMHRARSFQLLTKGRKKPEVVNRKRIQVALRRPRLKLRQPGRRRWRGDARLVLLRGDEEEEAVSRGRHRTRAAPSYRQEPSPSAAGTSEDVVCTPVARALLRATVARIVLR